MNNHEYTYICIYEDSFSFFKENDLLESVLYCLFCWIPIF